MSRPVLTVALDGSGKYKTVQEAVDAVPDGSKERTVIRVSPGIYEQPIYVPKRKFGITLVGISPEDTVLTWHNNAESIEHHQPPSVIGTETFACGSTIVEGDDFIAENITFENSYVSTPSIQAVALRVSAERCAFYNCRFLGWQDTLYLHRSKQYLKDCYIEGSVDFIFGNSTALFEHCHIHCKSNGFITAQSRESSEGTTGYVFNRCVVTGNGDKSYMYLGRPWRAFARVLFAHSYLDQCIRPEGWQNWNDPEKEKTACFYEYRCFGPGSCRTNRVEWSKELDEKEAEELLAHSFIDPDEQNPWLSQQMGTKIPNSALNMNADQCSK